MGGERDQIRTGALVRIPYCVWSSFPARTSGMTSGKTGMAHYVKWNPTLDDRYLGLVMCLNPV